MKKRKPKNELLLKKPVSFKLGRTYRALVAELAKQHSICQAEVIRRSLCALFVHRYLPTGVEQPEAKSRATSTAFTSAGKSMLEELRQLFVDEDASSLLRHSLAMMTTNQDLARAFLGGIMVGAEWGDGDLSLHERLMIARRKGSEQSVTDRVITRLVMDEGILDMRYFSRRTEHGTTYCLAGLILSAAGIGLKYRGGWAVGLARGEQAPSAESIEHELSQLRGDIPHEAVMIPARAREIWAAEHGDFARRILPLYAEDWGVGTAYDQITVPMVLAYIRGIEARVHVRAAA